MAEILKKLAVLFPGQGSQEKGMGREVAESDPEAMELWKLAEKACGGDLRGIYWDGDDAEMTETRWLQPALTVVTLNLWRAASSKIRPAFAAGHSLGEFSALCAAGALGLRETIELVSLRGRLMSEVGGGEGAMAAILKMDEDKVAEVVEKAAEATGKELRIANYNTPAQFVISGHSEAVEAAEGLVKEARGRVVRLPVSGAFHSPFMAEAAAELTGHMKKLSWNNAAFPVVLNVTGRPTSEAEEILDAMTKQMTSSVLWTQSLNSMAAEGVEKYVELGPKGVLTRMLKPNLGAGDWEGVNCFTLDQIAELSE